MLKIEKFVYDLWIFENNHCDERSYTLQGCVIILPSMVSLSIERPIGIFILATLLILLGIGGISGGLSLMADPSGDLMGLPLVLLESISLQTYLLPSMFLFVAMGILPLVATVGLLRGQKSAWIVTVGLSILLILWICFQIILWGAPIAIQIIYLVIGVVMLGLCFIPSIREYYQETAT
jgi:hypothetical protein